jgi:hypothetical protein
MRLRNRSVEERFTHFYRHNYWGSRETVSGLNTSTSSATHFPKLIWSWSGIALSTSPIKIFFRH